tara:strand:+ start:5791 stop:6390 length:600 start_codon:yes stop_codon:yes gene_type:complete
MILPSNIACVYLHGFLSSPKSKKAQELIQFFADHQMQNQLCVPTLSFEPAVAIQQAQEAIHTLQQQDGIDQVFVMGSSLGGFYATYLAQQENIKAVLINPAVRPYDLFDKYLGPNEHFYDGKTYLLETKHIEQLQAIDVEELTRPNDQLLLLQTGDETLDYRWATKKYIDCPSWIEPGGNHSYEGFMGKLASIFYFVQR